MKFTTNVIDVQWTSIIYHTVCKFKLDTQPVRWHIKRCRILKWISFMTIVNDTLRSNFYDEFLRFLIQNFVLWFNVSHTPLWKINLWWFLTTNSVNSLFPGKKIGYFASSHWVRFSVFLCISYFLHLSASLDLFLTVYN